MDLVKASVRRLENHLGVSNDDATILLITFKWDEDLIVEKWNTPDNDLISRAGIIFPSRSIFGGGVHVEEKIKDGELNIKCPLFQCDKMMASSRFLVDISADHKNMFEDGLIRNYNASKSRNDMVNSFNGYAAFHSGLGLVRGFVARIWSNKWKAFSTLLLLFLSCRLFYGCTGGTLQCVAELSILNILAMTASMGNILKVLFLYLLLKIVLNNHVLAAVVLSSVATSIVIFIVIAKAIRSCVRVVARRITFT